MAFSPNAQLFIEIIAGLIVTYIIYIAFLKALRSDQLLAIATGSTPYVDIIKGMAESSALVAKTFNTSVPLASGYVNVSPSINLKGGSQFSYSLWLNVGNPGAAVNQTIFLKGDPQAHVYDIYDAVHHSSVTSNERITMCPQLSFGKDPMSFVLTFNTLNNIKTSLVVDNQKNADSVKRHNMAALFAARWMLISMTFEDGMRPGEFDDGLTVRFYINDVLYSSGQYDTTIKQNKGNIHVFPDGVAIPDCKIANFVYYNHCLTSKEIKNLVREGPSTYNASVSHSLTNSSDENRASVLNISDFNRTNTYNT